MDSSDSVDSFLDKWRARWPEWELLSVFVPASQRPQAAAWFTLLQELGDAAWGGREPAPGLAKLAWWQEELAGWSRGARRHPLGTVLQRLDAPWDGLGRALAALPATRAPGSEADDLRALELFGSALLDCEASLFGGAVAEGSALAAIVDDLRVSRALAQGTPPAAPAPNGTPAGLSRPRRLYRVALHGRSRVPAGGTQVRPATLRVLLAGWRAARRG